MNITKQGAVTIRMFHLRTTNYTDEVIAEPTADLYVAGDEQLLDRMRVIVPDIPVLMYRLLNMTRPIERMIKDYDYTLQWAAHDANGRVMYDKDNPPGKGSYTIMNCTNVDWQNHVAKQTADILRHYGWDGVFLDNAYAYCYPNRWVVMNDEGQIIPAAIPTDFVNNYRYGIESMLRKLQAMVSPSRNKYDLPIVANVSRVEWSLIECQYVSFLMNEAYMQTREDKTQYGQVFATF